MAKAKKDILIHTEQALLTELAQLIEQSQQQVVAQANSTLTILFWHIGTRINKEILQNKRAEYSKQIVSTLSTQLKSKYGRNFELRNLRRMIQFAEQFTQPWFVSVVNKKAPVPLHAPELSLLMLVREATPRQRRFMI